MTFAFGNWKPGALFTSYTSPNDAFNSVHELAAVLAYDDSASRFPLSPKVILAFELKGQADGGANKGTYLELGVRPVVKLTDAGRYPLSLAIPVKLGLSAKDYYEGPTGSNTFGYFDTGFIASVPLAFMPSKTSWEVHGGVDFLWLGDNLQLLNHDDGFKPVGDNWAQCHLLTQSPFVRPRRRARSELGAGARELGSPTPGLSRGQLSGLLAAARRDFIAEAREGRGGRDGSGGLRRADGRHRHASSWTPRAAHEPGVSWSARSAATAAERSACTRTSIC